MIAPLFGSPAPRGARTDVPDEACPSAISAGEDKMSGKRGSTVSDND